MSSVVKNNHMLVDVLPKQAQQNTNFSRAEDLKKALVIVIGVRIPAINLKGL